MRTVLLSVAALIASLFILLAGNSLQFVILGLRADQAGFTTAAIGALTVGYYVGYALGTFQAPAIVRTIGHIRAFAAVASILSAVVLAHALLVTPWFWVPLRFVTGLCFAVLATVSESWLNARATRDVRGQVLSIAQVMAILGYAVGPLLTLVAAVEGFLLFALASILMSLGLIPVVMTRIGAPALPEGEGADSRYSLRRLMKETPLGLVGTLATGAIQGAVLGLGAVFASRLGYSDTGAALFVTGSLLAGMVAQLPLGILSDRIDRRQVIAWTSTILAVAAAVAFAWLTAAGGAGWAPIVLAAAISGVSAMTIYPLVIAYTNDRLLESSIMPAAATLILSFSIGSAFAGTAASVAMSLFGPAGLYLYLALILAGLGGFTFYRMAVREDPPLSAAEAAAAEEAGASSSWYESTVFAGTANLMPMDWEPEEEQLAFDFTFPELATGEGAADPSAA